MRGFASQPGGFIACPGCENFRDLLHPHFVQFWNPILIPKNDSILRAVRRVFGFRKSIQMLSEVESIFDSNFDSEIAIQFCNFDCEVTRAKEYSRESALALLTASRIRAKKQ